MSRNIYVISYGDTTAWGGYKHTTIISPTTSVVVNQNCFQREGDAFVQCVNEASAKNAEALHVDIYNRDFK